MSNKTYNEPERQFEADIEKAKALSMETLALEQFKQKQRSRGVSMPPTNSTTNDTTPIAFPTVINEVTLREYKNRLEQRIGRPLSGGSLDNFKSNTAVPRRPSDINPPQINRRDEPDLIAFDAPSPPKPKDPQTEAHESFKQLVEDMHK